jgi:hypothetical protein
MSGKVSFSVALIMRMWSSALFMLSDAAGLDVTRSEMKVAVSKGNLSFLQRCWWKVPTCRSAPRSYGLGGSIRGYRES